MNAQREMTLDEWCAQLHPEHRVNKELRELRAATDRVFAHGYNTRLEDEERTSGSAPSGDGVSLIAAERKRQITAEGWTPEHDDEHDGGELAQAAACYAAPPLSSLREHQPPMLWPWDECWWKPGDRVRELVKAGALIAAEIDRLQRADAALAALGGAAPAGDGITNAKLVGEVVSLRPDHWLDQAMESRAGATDQPATPAGPSAEAVDREVRQGRSFYFRHNPPSTMLAQIFNSILIANGTFESDIEANARRELAAKQPAAAPMQASAALSHQDICEAAFALRGELHDSRRLLGEVLGFIAADKAAQWEARIAAQQAVVDRFEAAARTAAQYEAMRATQP